MVTKSGPKRLALTLSCYRYCCVRRPRFSRFDARLMIGEKARVPKIAGFDCVDGSLPRACDCGLITPLFRQCMVDVKRVRDDYKNLTPPLARTATYG